MAKELRYLFEKAIFDISQGQNKAGYKTPNISQAQTEVDEILAAAGLPTTNNDEITNIYISDQYGYVSISTAFSVSSFSFPTSILDGENPIKAAKEWGLQTKLALLRRKIESAQDVIDRCNDEVSSIIRENSDFETPDLPKISYIHISDQSLNPTRYTQYEQDSVPDWAIDIQKAPTDREFFNLDIPSAIRYNS